MYELFENEITGEKEDLRDKSRDLKNNIPKRKNNNITSKKNFIKKNF